jgi:hypothetical protein
VTTAQEQTTLTTSEHESLHTCEATIERGLQTFYEVGAALLAIRDNRLYRAKYATFEDYCQQRWGMSRSNANRLVQGAVIFDNLAPIGAKPANEAQTRPLSRLDPEQQRVAWQEATETAIGGKVTAAHVEATVQAIEQPLTDEDLAHLKADIAARGGTYDGERRINGVVTRHNVTLPGQPQRQYTTRQLQELLSAYPVLPETPAPDPRARDRELLQQAQQALAVYEVDEAEHLALQLSDRATGAKDALMRDIQARRRVLLRARTEEPKAEFDPSPVSVALDDQFDEPEPAAAATEADTRLLDQAEQELPAWSLWIDEDGKACGGQHASGYKIGPVESVIELVNEARRLTPLLAEFAEHNWTCGYHVGLDLWTAEHMQYGTVQASNLPDLAFNAYLARYDGREPDLPRDLWQATWLEGWQFEGHLPGDRYRLVRGGEAWEPTYNELCHVYSYDEQPAPQPVPPVTFPHPLTVPVPDDLEGWAFQVIDAHHVRGTHPDYGTCTATGGAQQAFDQARHTQRQAQQKTKPIPSAEHTASLTRGEIRNLWKCLHGDQMWLSHARATVERLARQAGVELEEVAA